MGLEDDVIYLKILVFTFISSYFVKRISCEYRSTIGAVLGISTIMVVCGRQIFYSLPVVLVNLALIKCFPKTPLVNFIFCFGYLTFFRCAHLVCGGGLLPKYLPHANAVQLIMTLRCVGLAFELSDQKKAKDKERRSSNSDGGPSTSATFMRDKLEESYSQMFTYCYNLFGLFTGPYYSYRVYQDVIRCEYLRGVPCIQNAINRLMAVPFLIAMLLIVQAACPLEDAHKDEFFDSNTVLTFLFYPVAVFACFRMRCYVGWMLSEASCMVAGIGAYPKISKPKIGVGPTNIEAYEKVLTEIRNGKSLSEIQYDYETICNVGVYGCEFGSTLRESMRYWNSSVQYWLVTLIYRRCPWKSMRTALTFLVSAYWHGVYAGHYLSFMSIPICLYAEDLVFSILDRLESQQFDTSRHRLFWWFFRMRCFEYLAMAFLLLSYSSAIRYWASTFYHVHVALMILVIAALCIKKYL